MQDIKLSLLIIVPEFDISFLLALILQDSNTTLRLVDGSSQFEGRLEVFHNGDWGTVCDDSFGIVDANVVCRQLGYGSALEVHSNAFYGEGSFDSRIWLDDVDCDGNEDSIDQCRHTTWGNHNCGHDEDVGIRCSRNGKYK